MEIGSITNKCIKYVKIQIEVVSPKEQIEHRSGKGSKNRSNCLSREE